MLERIKEIVADALGTEVSHSTYIAKLQFQVFDRDTNDMYACFHSTLK